MQKDANFPPLFTSTEAGVQAVEKPQKPSKFGKIEHQNKGVADGQMYPLRLQSKCHGSDQLPRPTANRYF